MNIVPKIGVSQIKLLERLTNACAVSGDENEVRAIVLEQIRPFVDEARVDNLGSVLAIKRGQGEPSGEPSGEHRLHVLLAAIAAERDSFDRRFGC